MADPVSFGLTVALMGLQMAVTASRKIEGPRLDDLKVNTADFGTRRNYFYGIRRFDGISIFACEPITEIKKKRKTKGGKYNEYTYFGTFYCDIAAHEIAGITRIWWDRHLVYDATGAGPITPFDFGTYNRVARTELANSSPNAIEHITFYLGDENQMPDPRMLLTTEAKFGVGTCPAFRGTAYVAFEDVPLEKVGNRIPQVSIEAITVPATNYPYESFPGVPPGMQRLWGFTYSPDFSKFLSTQLGQYEIWDVAARTLLIEGTFSGSVEPNPEFVGITNAGYIFLPGYDQYGVQGIVGYNPDGSGAAGLAIETGLYTQQACVVRMDGNLNEHLFTIPYSYFEEWYSMQLTNGSFGASLHVPFDETGHAFKPLCYFTDAYGDIWLAGAYWGPFADATELFLQRIVEVGRSPIVSSLGIVTMPGGGPGVTVAAAHNAANLHFVVLWGSTIFTIDEATFAIKTSASPSIDPWTVTKQFANLRPESKSIWLNNLELSLTDLTTIRIVDITLWMADDADGSIYDPINHALIGAPQFTDVITWRYLDRIASSAVTLGSIADDIFARSGADPLDYDFSDLSQLVPGYSWVQGTGSQILEPLFDLYGAIIRPHGFIVEGLRLGVALARTITSREFVRDGSGDLFKQTIIQDTNLPRAVNVTFSDVLSEQAPNTILETRRFDAVDGRNVMTLDMQTLAEDPTAMRQYVQRWMRKQWQERDELEATLSPMQLELEPGDVQALSLNGVPLTGRIKSMTIQPDSRIDTQWTGTDPATVFALGSSTGALMVGRTPAAIQIPVTSKGVVIDAPLWRDVDYITNPFVYIAAAPYVTGATWAGVDYLVSDTGSIDEFQPWSQIPASTPMDWGYTSDTLGDAAENVLDYGNTVNVIMKYGTLTSVTEAEVLADPTLNVLLVGSEYIQFINANLESDGSYTLDGFVRGARGTEQHMATHVIGDTVVVMEAATMYGREMSVAEIGDTDYYRPVSQGRSVESAFEQTVTFTAATSKPYSPAHVELAYDGVDWTIDWIRRTRIGGGSIDGRDVPLGETAEEYRVDIMSGSVVVRTLAVTTNTATYTAAMQLADFGAAQSSLSVEVYQFAPLFGINGYHTAMAA